MSTWRRKAIESFPEFQTLIEEEGTTPYTLWIEELLPLCEEAHHKGDTETLKSIYDYAEWSFRTGDPKLTNAVAVCFYEHLIDDPAVKEAIPQWVSYDIFQEISGLLAYRSDMPSVDMIRKKYKAQAGNSSRK